MTKKEECPIYRGDSISCCTSFIPIQLKFTALGTAATVIPVIEANKVLQVEFFGANGSPIGPIANVTNASD